MKKKSSLFVLFFILLAGCRQDGAAINYVYEGTPVRINRFDTALMAYLAEEPALRVSDTLLFNRYWDFIELYISYVVPVEKKKSKQAIGAELVAFFSNPTLFDLYKDAVNMFSNTDVIEKELTAAFSFFAANFPAVKTPQIYFHVSGLNQNVVAGENILSLSIDKYLGEEYPLYEEFFYDYQRRVMLPERTTIDLSAGFLLSEFPYGEKEETLLNKMIYWGKIRYVLSKAFPKKDKFFILGYTPEQLFWCRRNEAAIWKQIVGNKHLYSKDRLLISKFIEPAPYTVPLGADAPPEAGIWVGWQIIEKYMQNNPQTSLQELMENDNYAGIFKKARYRP